MRSPGPRAPAVVMRRCRALLVATGLLASWLAVAPQAAASDIQVEDRLANRSRTYTAYTNDTGSIFEVTFQTTETGEKRRIRGKLEVIMPRSASDDVLVARHAVRCGPVGVQEYEQLYGVQNVLRGTTMLLKPRYTFTAGPPGEYRCWMWVGSGRPRPSGKQTSSNVFRVGWKSSIHATIPMHPGTGQSFDPDVPSTLLHKGQASDEAVLNWTAPDGVAKFSASGDAYLTTCTSVSGSTDPVTGKRLCEGIANLWGSTVITKLVVGQLRADGGGYCALSHFPSKSGRRSPINRDLHHLLVYNSGAVTVSTNPLCSRNFRIKVYVKVHSGSAVIVHRQGTLTGALPSA